MQSQQVVRYRYAFQSFGVKIGIESNNLGLLNSIRTELPEIVPEVYLEEYAGETEQNFLLLTDENKIRIDKNGGELCNVEFTEGTLKYFYGRISLAIAQNAVGKVFLHAGVIGYKGNAIIFPGDSFSGKTTIVSELIKQGAVYYSDEFAVLDENGLNYPFARKLSVRGIIDQYLQVDVAPEDFGAQTGKLPLPVKAVFLTQYQPDGKLEFELLSAGKGMLEMVPHTLTMASNPKYSLQVLNILANRAIIAKSKRGDAPEAVKFLLKFLETETV